METADRELLLELASKDTYLKKLYDEHLELEREVERLEKYSPFSTTAELKSKNLKKRKLKGMDSIMSILSEYKRGSCCQQPAA